MTSELTTGRTTVTTTTDGLPWNVRGRARDGRNRDPRRGSNGRIETPEHPVAYGAFHERDGFRRSTSLLTPVATTSDRVPRFSRFRLADSVRFVRFNMARPHIRQHQAGLDEAERTKIAAGWFLITTQPVKGHTAGRPSCGFRRNCPRILQGVTSAWETFKLPVSRLNRATRPSSIQGTDARGAATWCMRIDRISPELVRANSENLSIRKIRDVAGRDSTTTGANPPAIGCQQFKPQAKDRMDSTADRIGRTSQVARNHAPCMTLNTTNRMRLVPEWVNAAARAVSIGWAATLQPTSLWGLTWWVALR